MKKIICKKEYDTDTATLIQKCTHGTFGDDDGYEESLYRMPEGHYFLYVNGGAASLHPTEEIHRLSAARADAWLAEHK